MDLCPLGFYVHDKICKQKQQQDYASFLDAWNNNKFLMKSS